MLRKLSVSLISGLLWSSLVVLTGIPRTSAQATSLHINEILVGNASTNLDTDYYNYSSWIEIYNSGSSPVDLKNHTLSYLEHDVSTPVLWRIPDSVIVPAKSMVLFWADERDEKRTHANFELDMRGSKISLLSPANDVIDAVTYDMRSDKVLLPDISYGRQVDGGNTWVYFDQPTPAAANTTPGLAAPDLAEKPVFAPPGGFYTGNQTVRLSTMEVSSSIRYTTDGSIPTSSSNLYTGALSISAPTVIRARVFAPGKLASQTASHTYLIDVSRNLPVISLATKPAHFFDDMIGIYVKGTNGIPGKCDEERANWNRKWERPISIEMYETNGSRVVAQDVGVEIHGGCTRVYDRKSLELKARRTYGDNDIDYRMLPDKPIDSYKRLILRNSGNDAHDTLFRDALQQYLVKDVMDIDYQAYRPVLVFLNGAYWGIHNLRDKADEAFVEQNYDLDADTDFDMIEGRDEVNAGNMVAWKALYSFISTKDLRIQSNYEYVKSQVDIDEFMNYYITEIYINNSDWPDTNIRYWRAYDNGRWRWVLYDLDFGFEASAADANLLDELLTCTDCSEFTIYQATVFRKLMANTEFRHAFVQRFASHISLTFSTDRVNGMIDAFRSGIEPEMPAHIARWGSPSSMAEWDAKIGDLRSFGDLRPANMTAHLNSYLGSPGMAELTVNTEGSGDMYIAGVRAPGNNYSGMYFKTIPVTLEAMPQPGWLFKLWQETGSTNPRHTIVMSGGLSRTAVFVEATDTAYLPYLHVSGSD